MSFWHLDNFFSIFILSAESIDQEKIGGGKECEPLTTTTRGNYEYMCIRFIVLTLEVRIIKIHVYKVYCAYTRGKNN